MSKKINIEDMHWRNILSGLWIYFLLNILFRDVHEFLRTGYLEQVMSGTVNGNKITEEVLLYSGIALQIPLLMTVLSRILVDTVNRLSNILASVVMFVSIVAFTQNPDMDDIVFSVMEGLTLVAICYFSWRGPRIGSRVDITG